MIWFRICISLLHSKAAAVTTLIMMFSAMIWTASRIFIQTRFGQCRCWLRDYPNFKFWRCKWCRYIVSKSLFRNLSARPCSSSILDIRRAEHDIIGMIIDRHPAIHYVIVSINLLDCEDINISHEQRIHVFLPDTVNNNSSSRIDETRVLLFLLRHHNLPVVR